MKKTKRRAVNLGYDGAIKNVNHALARLKAAYADLTRLKPSEIVTD